MNRKALLKDTALVIIGSILYGAALAIFLTPRNIVMGGASGISVTIHALTQMPVGVGMARHVPHDHWCVCHVHLYRFA